MWGAAGSGLACPGLQLACPVGVAINKGGSILNGRYWYHIAFPFTPVAFRLA
jgi:hypothetical protein